MWRMSYGEDSFFTLSVGERFGLVLLSLAIWAALLSVVWRWGGLVLAVGLFWAFVWLSPQVYYVYYLAIFDRLPLQAVVGWPPGPTNLIRLMTFSDRATLSHYGQDGVGWSLIALALLRPVMRRRAKRGKNT